ncbi:MAG: tRNA adenosine(34) deaminase TadA [Pyramidobacter sp.]|nr:tRNA adenosine(34) deaminase TadA [Pyramidobacter sp.]
MKYDDAHYMNIALQLAQQAAEEGDIPVGAVITDSDGNVIGKGRNRRRAEYDPTAHAEIVAIRQSAEHLRRWNLSGCTLYVTLEPCPMCAGAVVQSRISRVVYGCADPKAGACGTLYNIARDSRLFHRAKITAHVMEDECRKILQDFFFKCRQKNK